MRLQIAAQNALRFGAEGYFLIHFYQTWVQPYPWWLWMIPTACLPCSIRLSRAILLHLMCLQIDAQIGVGDVTVRLHFHHFLRRIANSQDDARETYKFNQCHYTYAQAHKLQTHKMTHTGEKAHNPSLPHTRTKRSMPRSIQLLRATLFDYINKFGSLICQAFGGGMPTILTILPLCDVCEDEFVVLRSIGWLSFQFYSPATDRQPVIVSALTSMLQIADRNYPSGSLNRHVTAVTIQLLKEATWEWT